MDQANQSNRYLLLNEQGQAVANCLLQSPMDAPALQVRILDDKIDAVLRLGQLQLVGMDPAAPSLVGRIVRSRGDSIVIEKLRSLGAEARQNLRSETPFRSFIYPVSGSWRGRRAIRGNDLSCGGISFFTDAPLEVGERVEIIVPITVQPLILTCEILRWWERGEQRLYAAKFVDLIYDEEVLVREAVFGAQIGRRVH